MTTPAAAEAHPTLAEFLRTRWSWGRMDVAALNGGSVREATQAAMKLFEACATHGPEPVRVGTDVSMGEALQGLDVAKGADGRWRWHELHETDEGRAVCWARFANTRSLVDLAVAAKGTPGNAATAVDVVCDLARCVTNAYARACTDRRRAYVVAQLGALAWLGKVIAHPCHRPGEESKMVYRRLQHWGAEATARLVALIDSDPTWTASREPLVSVLAGWNTDKRTAAAMAVLLTDDDLGYVAYAADAVPAWCSLSDVNWDKVRERSPREDESRLTHEYHCVYPDWFMRMLHAAVTCADLDAAPSTADPDEQSMGRAAADPDTGAVVRHAPAARFDGYTLADVVDDVYNNALAWFFRHGPAPVETPTSPADVDALLDGRELPDGVFQWTPAELRVAKMRCTYRGNNGISLAGLARVGLSCPELMPHVCKRLASFAEGLAPIVKRADVPPQHATACARLVALAAVAHEALMLDAAGRHVGKEWLLPWADAVHDELRRAGGLLEWTGLSLNRRFDLGAAGGGSVARGTALLCLLCPKHLHALLAIGHIGRDADTSRTLEYVEFEMAQPAYGGNKPKPAHVLGNLRVGWHPAAVPGDDDWVMVMASASVGDGESAAKRLAAAD